MVNKRYESIVNKTNSNYLGEIIEREEIEQWIDNSMRIGIHTTTGSGKTTLINSNLLEVLQERGLQGVFISSRKSIIEQSNQQSIHMHYETIQSIIYNYVINQELPNANILIIDEYHHIINDSAFNKEIHILKDIIEEMNIPTIFISATPPQRNIFNLDYEITDDRLGKEVHRYNNVKVYHHRDEIMNVLDDIITNTDDKVLVYINNSRILREIYDIYYDISMINCSDNNRELIDIRDINKISGLLNDNKFNDRILLTTKVIDSGVNIIDQDLKHIIVFSYDVEEVLQVVGRKRDNKEDLNIYLKNYTPNELGGLKSTLKRDLNILERFRENPKEIIKLCMNTNRIENKSLFKIDDNLKFKINEVEEERIKTEYIKLDRLTKNGFIKELERVNIYGEDMTYKREWTELEGELKRLYENNIVYLNRESREPLINLINYRENRELRKSLRKLNKYLENRKSNFRIEQFKTSRTIDGQREQYSSAWRITLSV